MATKAKPKTCNTTAAKTLSLETLNLTFDLLRGPCPALALEVRNLTMQRFIPTKSITVALSNDQIEHVIQNLLALCLIESQYADAPKLTTLRELLKSWISIANQQHLFEDTV
jgi:hypothetical protein